MSLRSKNRNRPKLRPLPKIENPIIRGTWDCTPPEEQGIGFAPWDHQEKNCYCHVGSLDFDPIHDVEQVRTDRAANWPDLGPDSFGGSDFPLQYEVENFDAQSIPKAEEEIKMFYSQHPEVRNLNIDKDAWIQTWTGKKFYPQNPTAESICIQDIANALANQCRFTGHTSVHYSVAQHCVLVSYLCNPEHALQGLLHDASEAYLVDVASPIKRLPEMAGYRELEKKVQNAIYRKFNLPEEEPKDVKRADLIMLSLESQSFMSPLHPDWKMPFNIPTLKIEALSADEAFMLFTGRFHELYSKSDI
jgi:hypothetical protein